jgi:hypothetical protein
MITYYEEEIWDEKFNTESPTQGLRAVADGRGAHVRRC